MFIHLFVSLSAYPLLIQVCVWFVEHYKSRAGKDLNMLLPISTQPVLADDLQYTA